MKKKLVVLTSFLLLGITSPLWAAQTMMVHFVNATAHTITLICHPALGHDCGNLPSTVAKNESQDWGYVCASSGNACPTPSSPEHFSAQVKKIKFKNDFYMYQKLMPYRQSKEMFWVIMRLPPPSPSLTFKTNSWPYAITVYFYTASTKMIQIAMCRGKQNNCTVQ